MYTLTLFGVWGGGYRVIFAKVKRSRSSVKLVYFDALFMIQRQKWISQNSTKGGTFGSAEGWIPEGSVKTRHLKSVSGSIDLSRQSEQSGLRPDASSLVRFVAKNVGALKMWFLSCFKNWHLQRQPVIYASFTIWNCWKKNFLKIFLSKIEFTNPIRSENAGKQVFLPSSYSLTIQWMEIINFVISR